MRLNASHRCASTWSGDLECVSGVSHSPKLPVNPSIFQENAGSPGWRPAGGYARTAGLRLGFSTAAKEGRAEVNWGGSARRVRLFGKPKMCCLLPPKEDTAPRRSDSRETEREKPRARRDTTERRCCPFPTPPPRRGRGGGCSSCFIIWESATVAPPTGHCHHHTNKKPRNAVRTVAFFPKSVKLRNSKLTGGKFQSIYYVNTHNKTLYKK